MQSHIYDMKSHISQNKDIKVDKCDYICRFMRETILYTILYCVCVCVCVWRTA